MKKEEKLEKIEIKKNTLSPEKYQRSSNTKLSFKKSFVNNTIKRRNGFNTNNSLDSDIVILKS